MNGSRPHRALQVLAVLGAGALLVVGTIILRSQREPPELLESHDTLKTQRQLGWNFGAPGVALAFPGHIRFPFEPESLSTLPAALAPRQEALKPLALAPLFLAVSNDALEAPPASARSLREVLRPLSTPGMDEAFHQGQALAGLFDAQEEAALVTAVLVDLPGPESVAFTAALARRFEPVFLFDGWPHPLGVVPAHLTLSAVAYHLALLQRLATERRVPAPPVFVLDRERLAPYTEPSTQLDNRSMARVPSAAQLRKLGLQHVLYVHPGGDRSRRELDDLNAELVAWKEAGLDVRLVAASDFWPDPAEAGRGQVPFYFGGSPVAQASFWTVYPWGRPRGLSDSGSGIPAGGILSADDLARVPADLSGGYAYEPERRTTLFAPASDGEGAAPRARPAGFGEVRMRVSRQGRTLLGPTFTVPGG